MSHVGQQRVLVTGGASGIGRAVAEALLRAGGKVAVTGRRIDVLADFAAQHPGRVFPLACDLRDHTQRIGLVSRAKQALGGIDGLVHSAGVVHHEAPGKISDASLREQLEVNLVAGLRLGEDALELLEAGGGVVYVSSTLAARPLATSAAYSASKAGMLAAMKSLALAGAARRVRFNAVLPGIVETPMTQERLVSGRSGLDALHPLGRIGTPDDVAGTVLHLLGAPWMTGSEVVLDGGLLLRG